MGSNLFKMGLNCKWAKMADNGSNCTTDHHYYKSVWQKNENVSPTTDAPKSCLPFYINQIPLYELMIASYHGTFFLLACSKYKFNEPKFAKMGLQLAKKGPIWPSVQRSIIQLAQITKCKYKILNRIYTPALK